MAQLPYSDVGGQAAPGTIGLPDNYQRITASPDAFGAGIGAADQKLGAAAEQAGGTALSIATQQQAIDNTVEASHALANFKAAVTAKSFGNPQDPSEAPAYFAQQGAQALSSYKPALDDLEQTRSKILNGMTPGAARIFDQSSLSLMGDTTAKFDAHRATAQQQYQGSSFDALAQSSQNAAIAGSADPDTFAHNLADGRTSILNKASLYGWSPEVISQQLAEYNSSTYKAVATRLELSNPLAAAAYVQANQDKLLPADLAALQGRLQPAVFARSAQDAAHALVTQYGGGGAGTAPASTSQPKNKADFVAQWGPEAQRIAPGLGVAPETILAHWGQETAWGASLHDNNVGNIQAGSGYGGRTVVRGDTTATGEAYKTQFRAYDSPAQAADDYAALLKGGRYSAALNTGGDALAFGQGLKAGGYMANPNGPRDIAASAKGLTIPPASGQPAQGIKLKPIAFGDELAAGAAQANGFATGATQSGATPDQVLDAINGKPPGSIPAGTPVVLSTGLTADPTKLDVVQQQIDSLKARGVTDIRLLGVGAASGSAVNPHLQDLAKQNNITFVPVQAGQDGAHPDSYAGVGVPPVLAAAPPPKPAPDWEAMERQVATLQDPTGRDDLAYQQRVLTNIRTQQRLQEFTETRERRQGQAVLLNAIMGQPTPGYVPPAAPGATPTPTTATPTGGPAPSGPPAPGGGTPIQPAPPRPTSLPELFAYPGALDAYKNATPQQQQGIEKALERNAAPIDPPETPHAQGMFYQLRGMAASDPETFHSINLADPQIMSTLPHTMWRALVDDQAKAVTAADKAQWRDTSQAHAVSVLKPDLLAAGIKVDGIKPGTQDAATLDQFVGKLRDGLDQFKQDNNRRPNDGEVAKIGQALLMQGTERGSGWLFGDKGVRAFQTTPDKFAPVVPPADKAGIVAAYQQLHPGQVPTEGQIAEVWMTAKAGAVAPRARSAAPGAMGPPASAAPPKPAPTPAPAQPNDNPVLPPSAFQPDFGLP